MRGFRWLIAVVALLGIACETGRDPTPVPSTTAAATTSPTPRVTYLNTPAPTPAWTRTPEPEPTAEPIGHPAGTTTGIPTVDAVVQAFTSGDQQALNDLVDWQVEPCVRPPVNDYGPPPVCQEDQETGDPTQFIPVSACHGGYRTPAEEEYTFEFARNGGLLYGVRAPLERDDPRAQYIVLFTTTSGQNVYGHAFGVSDRGIVNQELGCGFSPEYLWRRPSAEGVILAPPEDALYGYPPELRIDDGGVVDQVAVAVALRLPAELRVLLSPQERRCLPDIGISYQRDLDCSNDSADLDEPMFLVSGCHFGLRTFEEFERSLYDLLERRPRLYGARQITGWPDDRAEVALFFARPADEIVSSFVVLVGDGIVGLDGSCGEEPDDTWAKYDRFATGEALLAPFASR